MKILFHTDRRQAPSTIFNIAKLQRISESGSVSIVFFSQEYSGFDVVLFMGYDPQIEKARKENPNAAIGVIDPRPGLRSHLTGADFIVVNGLEMADYYSAICDRIFTYYIVPELPLANAARTNNARLTIGYHGNRVHLDGMHPRVTEAIDRLGQSMEVEVRLMYNIADLGKWNAWNPVPGVLVRHIQWSDENYLIEMAGCDIGIVPGLIPVQRERACLQLGATLRKRYNEESSDFLLRFKATSNPGRAFVFAHFGIPVVADMCPSLCQIIQDGKSGFICRSSDAWFRALHCLATDGDMRKRQGVAFNNYYRQNATTEVQNRELVSFLYQTVNEKRMNYDFART